MAGRDNVTFVFSIENRKFMVKGKQMGAMLTDIQRSGIAASKGLQTVGNEGTQCLSTFLHTRNNRFNNLKG